MKIFTNCTVVLEFDTTASYKDKTTWRKKITDNGGIISYVLTKRASFFVLFNKKSTSSAYKLKQSGRYNIPVVSPRYVDQCLERERLLPTDSYRVASAQDEMGFKKGKIQKPASHGTNRSLKKFRKTVNLASHTSWTHGDPDAPEFDEERFELPKWTILKDKTGSCAQVLEIHANMTNQQDQSKFRVFSQNATLKNNSVYKMDEAVCWYFGTSLEVISAYEQLYRRYTTPPCSLIPCNPGDLNLQSLGSRQLRLVFGKLSILADTISPQVAALTEMIWNEALEEVDSQLEVSLQHIKPRQIDEAEVLLCQMADILTSSTPDENKLQSLSEKFYEELPHKDGSRKKPMALRDVVAKRDLCQMLRDIVAVSEATDWSTDATTVAKYRALGCQIKHLDQSENEVKDVVLAAGNRVEVLNVFSVKRTMEEVNFANDIGNVQLLLHASAAYNCLGILSRGLLLPQTVKDKFGVSRTDTGNLGAGIYFSNSAQTSIKYSSPCKVTGSRLMLVCDVALGHVYETTSTMLELSSAPEGYDSVHGVKASSEVNSFFQDDEFTVYSTSQQCIRYLVEFCLPEDKPRPLEGTTSFPQVIQLHDASQDQEWNLQEAVKKIDISDVKDKADPLDSVKAGLQGNNKERVPLKSVHVRGKMMDMVAQVVVLQEYRNDSQQAIEAKYVFPLDDTAAVCGFEAFINGKHIIGEVKEKATARKEYKAAIEKGHGAYLMEEETPDVFSVSVGNLPPKSDVLIKITYIAELQVDGEHICFSLPSAVMPWVKESALAQKTQSEVHTVKVKDNKKCNTSVQVSIEMPFDIRRINSPTHSIKCKKTATKAVVELPPNTDLGKTGFLLHVALAEIHVPRMWVEKHPELDSHACMLTFYPEFESESDGEPEMLFLLDMSNSMKGTAEEDARKVLLLILDHLPQSCRFNILAFGNKYKELFPSPQKYSKFSLETAIQFVQECEANMGSTEIWEPLRSAHILSPADGTLQNLFLISDGHVMQEKHVVMATRLSAQKNRVFTLGVGPTVNQHTLRNLSAVGGGSYQFYNRDIKSQWQRKVKSQLEKATQPGLSEVCVDWLQTDRNVPTPVQAPNQIPCLFSGTRQVVYGFAESCMQATLTAKVNGQQVSTMVSTVDLNITTGKMLHQLAARAMINDFENGVLDDDRVQHQVLKTERKQYIIDLSKRYSIVTPYTSFVAVEERDKDESVKDAPPLKELIDKETVDLLPYIEWDKSFGQSEQTPEVAIQELMTRGAVAETFSMMQAEDYYTQIAEYKEHLTNPDNIQLAKQVYENLGKFYQQNKSAGVGDILSDLEPFVEASRPVTVTIKSMLGDTIVLDQVAAGMSVKDLKQKIKSTTGISERDQMIKVSEKSRQHETLDVLDPSVIFSGSDLKDTDTLAQFAENTDHLNCYLFVIMRGREDLGFYEMQLQRSRPLGVHVKTLTGKTVTCAADSAMTVAMLKRQIQEREGIPPDQQRLVVAGRQMEDSDILDKYAGKDYKLDCHLVLRLRGGPSEPVQPPVPPKPQPLPPPPPPPQALAIKHGKQIATKAARKSAPASILNEAELDDEDEEEEEDGAEELKLARRLAPATGGLIEEVEDLLDYDEEELEEYVAEGMEVVRGPRPASSQILQEELMDKTFLANVVAIQVKEPTTDSRLLDTDRSERLKILSTMDYDEYEKEVAEDLARKRSSMHVDVEMPVLMPPEIHTANIDLAVFDEVQNMPLPEKEDLFGTLIKPSGSAKRHLKVCDVERSESPVPDYEDEAEPHHPPTVTKPQSQKLKGHPAGRRRQYTSSPHTMAEPVSVFYDPKTEAMAGVAEHAQKNMYVGSNVSQQNFDTTTNASQPGSLFLDPYAPSGSLFGTPGFGSQPLIHQQIEPSRSVWNEAPGVGGGFQSILSARPSVSFPDNAQPAAFSFGGSAANSQPATGFGFVGPPQTSDSTGLHFGGQAQTSASTEFAFGGRAQTSATTGFAFGGPAQTSATTGFGFGGQAQTSASTGLHFGGRAQTSASNEFTFGGPAQTSASTGFAFGGPAQTSATTGFGFGGQAPMQAYTFRIGGTQQTNASTGAQATAFFGAQSIPSQSAGQACFQNIMSPVDQGLIHETRVCGSLMPSTSPAYSPTSPVYEPTSPAREDSFKGRSIQSGQGGGGGGRTDSMKGIPVDFRSKKGRARGGRGGQGGRVVVRDGAMSPNFNQPGTKNAMEALSGVVFLSATNKDEAYKDSYRKTEEVGNGLQSKRGGKSQEQKDRSPPPRKYVQRGRSRSRDRERSNDKRLRIRRRCCGDLSSSSSRSRSASPTRRSRSISRSRSRGQRSPEKTRHCYGYSSSYSSQSRSASATRRGSRSPSYTRRSPRSRSPGYSRRLRSPPSRSISPGYSRRRSRSPSYTRRSPRRRSSSYTRHSRSPRRRKSPRYSDRPSRRSPDYVGMHSRSGSFTGRKSMSPSHGKRRKSGSPRYTGRRVKSRSLRYTGQSHFTDGSNLSLIKVERRSKKSGNRLQSSSSSSSTSSDHNYHYFPDSSVSDGDVIILTNDETDTEENIRREITKTMSQTVSDGRLDEAGHWTHMRSGPMSITFQNYPEKLLPHLKKVSEGTSDMDKEMYWELSETVCRLLGISRCKVQQVLIHQGILSLGATHQQIAERVLASLLVLIAVVKLTYEETHGVPLTVTTTSVIDIAASLSAFGRPYITLDGTRVEIHNLFLPVVNWLRRMDKELPPLYNSLELGRSRQEFITQLAMIFQWPIPEYDKLLY